jgi:putative FmdB family regulatory protein
MPRYDFRCQECGETFETELPISRRQEAVCPECGSRDLRQLFLSVQTWVRGGGDGGAVCATGG